MSTQHLYWHEGLFLQPQHFQQFQKQILDQFGTERQLTMHYGWGVLEVKISTDDLKKHVLRLQSLRVVMPGGAVISCPENAHLPSLDIRAAFSSNPQGVTVLLGLPRWFSDERPNTVQDDGQRHKARYRVARQTPAIRDENTGEDPLPLQFRLYNVMLLLDLPGSDHSEIETIPLFRIQHDVAGMDVAPRIDPTFVHPSLLLNGSPTLLEMVRGIAAKVEAVRVQLEGATARSTLSSTISRPDFEHYLRLRSLNRFTVRVQGLLDVGQGNAEVPPFDVYQELQSLLADLTALYPEKQKFLPEPYNHWDPYLCFDVTIARIRSLLHGSVAQKFWKVEFVPIPNSSNRIASLEPKHFPDPRSADHPVWYLGIQTNLDHGSLVELIRNHQSFALLPPSYLAKLVSGIQLSEERSAPYDLPSGNDRYYFRLNTVSNPPAWKDARDELALAIRWTSRVVFQFQATLFIEARETD